MFAACSRPPMRWPVVTQFEGNEAGIPHCPTAKISGMAKPRRPRDSNQLAKLIVDLSTGDAGVADVTDKQQAISAARSKSGQRGAEARKTSLSPDQRTAIASVAAAARWKRGKS